MPNNLSFNPSIVAIMYKEYLRKEAMAPRTKAALDVVIKRFTDVCGNIPVASVSQEHITQFREALIQTPARMTFKQQQLPLLQAIELTKPLNPKTLSPDTVEHSIELFENFLEWANEQYPGV